MENLNYIDLRLDSNEYYTPYEDRIIHVIPNVKVINSKGKELGTTIIKEIL